MYIKRATKEDISAIRHLLESTPGKFTFLDSCINKRDLSYCVRSEDGELVGFLWCGFMANNKIAHIDHFCVAPSHRHKSIAKDLATIIFTELTSRGVEYCNAFSMPDVHQLRLLKSLSNSGPGAGGAKVTQGLMLEWFKG